VEEQMIRSENEKQLSLEATSANPVNQSGVGNRFTAVNTSSRYSSILTLPG
jgi:hypothetical protein